MRTAGEGSDPLITVIIPTHNRPDLLATAVCSVLDQTVKAFELIVVDDASTPPASVSDDPRVRLIRLGEPAGVAHARNVGITNSTAPLLCFLDDDDAMTPVRLQIALDHKDDPVLVCAGGVIGSTGSSGAAGSTLGNFAGDVSGSIVDTTTPHLGCISIQTAIAPLFDTLFVTCEDVDWLIRLANVHPFAIDRRTGWLWRRHDGPRPELSDRARLAGSRQLLEVHRVYFASHRRAASFRWFRVATYALQAGCRLQAMKAAARSAYLHPDPRTIARSARIWLQVTMRFLTARRADALRRRPNAASR